jgi:hypothetical protein
VKREVEAARGVGAGAASGMSWGAGAACGATLGFEVPAIEDG